jgi:predicted nucleic acid-binding protein
LIVLEASAMVAALVDEPANPELLTVLAAEELHAPNLLDFEVASALRGHIRGSLLTLDRVHEALDDFAELQIERYAMTDTLRRIMALRDNFTVYDAAYVVLAQALGVTLVTCDNKLKEARRFGVDVQVFR